MPGVQEYPAIQQTFENLTRAMFEEFFSQRLETFIATATDSIIWFDRPEFWTNGTVRTLLKTQAPTATGTMTMDLNLFGQTCGGVFPVSLFSNTGLSLPFDGFVKCFDFQSTLPLNLAQYDLLGLAIQNISHATDTTVVVQTMQVVFQPTIEDA